MRTRIVLRDRPENERFQTLKLDGAHLEFENEKNVAYTPQGVQVMIEDENGLNEVLIPWLNTAWVETTGISNELMQQAEAEATKQRIAQVLSIPKT